MDNKVDSKKQLCCKYCIKDYSSYKSLWNHNKNFIIKKTDKF